MKTENKDLRPLKDTEFEKIGTFGSLHLGICEQCGKEPNHDKWYVYLYEGKRVDALCFRELVKDGFYEKEGGLEINLYR
jgi:hypothetical protein